MRETKACACSGAKSLIFACSGACDVGEIADRAARKISRDGVGKMYCMAGIGGRVDAIVKTAQTAGAILAINGCALNCANRSLTEAGFEGFESLFLAELGLEKGKSPVTDEAIAKVANQAKDLLTKTHRPKQQTHA
ncbi:MAG: putative zinc-binding protein [Rhizomicrobium sp.]